jgi:hypothetical protein
MKRSRAIRCGCGTLALASLLFLGGGSPAAADSQNGQLGGNGAPAPTGEQSHDVQVITLLERMGRYDEAEAHCIQILEQKPNDQDAKRLLGELQEKRRQQNPSLDLRHRLENIIIPEVSVRDAAAADVIDILQAEGQKRSGDKAPINFVWQAPDDTKAAKVTLNLRNIPLTDALKYVTDGVGLRYRVEQYAVVIYKPLPAASKESGPSNVKSP